MDYGKMIKKRLTESASEARSWPDSKELTYREAQQFAMAHYSKGGDAFYETWEEYQFNDYVKQFGPMTVKDMKSMFLTQYNVQKDMEGSGQYQESLSKKVRESSDNDKSRESFRKFLRDNHLLKAVSSKDVSEIEDKYVNGVYDKTTLVNELWAGDTFNRSRQDIEELVNNAGLIAPKVDQEFENVINVLYHFGKPGSKMSPTKYYELAMKASEKYGFEVVKQALLDKSSQEK